MAFGMYTKPYSRGGSAEQTTFPLSLIMVESIAPK